MSHSRRHDGDMTAVAAAAYKDPRSHANAFTDTYHKCANAQVGTRFIGICLALAQMLKASLWKQVMLAWFFILKSPGTTET